MQDRLLLPENKICGTSSVESFFGIVTFSTPLSSSASIASESKLRLGK